MSEIKLLPCPLCGESVEIDEIPPHTHSIATFMVDCDGLAIIECKCGCSITRETREKAIKVWNTRKPMDKIVEQLEEEKEYSYSEFSHYINEYELSLDDEYDDFFHKGLGRAIDIIRAGGKE